MVDSENLEDPLGGSKGQLPSTGMNQELAENAQFVAPGEFGNLVANDGNGFHVSTGRASPQGRYYRFIAPQISLTILFTIS